MLWIALKVGYHSTYNCITRCVRTNKEGNTGDPRLLLKPPSQHGQQSLHQPWCQWPPLTNLPWWGPCLSIQPFFSIVQDCFEAMSRTHATMRGTGTKGEKEYKWDREKIKQDCCYSVNRDIGFMDIYVDAWWVGQSIILPIATLFKEHLLVGWSSHYTSIYHFHAFGIHLYITNYIYIHTVYVWIQYTYIYRERYMNI